MTNTEEDKILAGGRLTLMISSNITKIFTDPYFLIFVFTSQNSRINNGKSYYWFTYIFQIFKRKLALVYTIHHAYILDQIKNLVQYLIYKYRHSILNFQKKI